MEPALAFYMVGGVYAVVVLALSMRYPHPGPLMPIGLSLAASVVEVLFLGPAAGFGRLQSTAFVIAVGGGSYALGLIVRWTVKNLRRKPA